MPDSKTYKIIVMMEDGELHVIGGVDFEGAIWLVPEWLAFQSQGYTKPERMIRLDRFQFQAFVPPAKGPGPFAGADFAIPGPLPKALFYGEIPQQLKDTPGVRIAPDIKFRTGGTHH